MQTNIKYLLVFIIFIKTPMLFSQSNDGNFVVVLDAGHGGKDPGRPTKFEKEKNVALNIVLGIGKALEKEDNVKVIKLDIGQRGIQQRNKCYLMVLILHQEYQILGKMK